MENASLEIFKYVSGFVDTLKLKKKVGIICGKGNNGGDGFAVARHFVNDGYHVTIIHLGKEDELSGDAQTNFRIIKNIARDNGNITIKYFSSLKDILLFSKCDVVLDALLGSGTKGELRSPYDKIVDELNKLRSFKIAIDIPTGLDADTGYAKQCFKADLTVTLGEFKKGLFFGDGSLNCGKVIKGNIGVANSYFDRFDAEEFLIEPEDVVSNLPVRKKDAHKYSAGKVFTIAGSGDLPGAAALTAKAALKAGAGSSILAFPKSVRKLVHKNLNEVIVKSFDDGKSEILRPSNIKELNDRLKWADVAAIGPGLGRDEETQDAVRKIIKDRKCKKFVIDADAVYALRKNYYKEINLKNFVLTPHHGEFAGLLGIETDELEQDLLVYGKKFVSDTGTYLVLKGAPTIIFSPDGKVYINTTGNPGMAKFGTGDVLTGVLAGFISQQKDLLTAVINGVYLHSLSADLLIKNYTEFSYTATDILKNLPAAIKFLRKSFA